MGFLIKWVDGDSAGFSDLIDESWLEAKEPVTGLSHPTFRFRGRDYTTSRFDLIPTDGALLFSYGGEHAEANAAAGICIGDMKIDLTAFPADQCITWRDEGADDFSVQPVTIEPVEAFEGQVQKKSWTSRTRDRRLVEMKWAEAQLKNAVMCEACETKGRPEYGQAARACFEVHHKRPLSEGERTTDPADLALICANCHNVLHALKMTDFEDFLRLFGRGR